MGLSCTAAGLSLAGVPLLRKTAAGFIPRPDSEITKLVAAACRAEPTELSSRLGVIAEALNRGDLAGAMIIVLQARIPELSLEAAARLAKAEQKLTKYNFNAEEPRDLLGRWTRDGVAGSTNSEPPAGRGRPIQVADAGGPRLSDASPVAAVPMDDEPDGDASHEPTSLEQVFERKYDDLGPTEFAKQVIQFGDLLGRQGKNLSATAKDRVLAEYSFLQDRLSFWLGYDYKPPASQNHLLSAALSLYQGAINGGIVSAGHLPQSMLDVAGASGRSSNNDPPRIRPSLAPRIEEPPSTARLQPPRKIEGRGGKLKNSEVGMIWGRGIKDQGEPWETYNDKQYPPEAELSPNSKAFDQFEQESGEAVSDKAMNTLSVSYIKKPQRIYWQLRAYVRAAADYKPGVKTDVDPTKIKSKTIQLAIPEYTSPEQWRYLFAAIIYGKERRVRVVVTEIEE